jgi:hypothetical protein
MLGYLPILFRVNCSSLCPRTGYATIVLAMDPAGKISHSSVSDQGHVLALTVANSAQESLAPGILRLAQRSLWMTQWERSDRRHASRRAGERANPPPEKINRSHRVAENRSSIGKAFRRRFSAGMALGEAIEEASKEARTPSCILPRVRQRGRSRMGCSRREGRRRRREGAVSARRGCEIVARVSGCRAASRPSPRPSRPAPS